MFGEVSSLCTFHADLLEYCGIGRIRVYFGMWDQHADDLQHTPQSAGHQQNCRLSIDFTFLQAASVARLEACASDAGCRHQDPCHVGFRELTMHMIIYSRVQTVVAPMIPMGLSRAGFFACVSAAKTAQLQASLT